MIEKIEEDLSTVEGNISKGKETIESLQSSGNIIKELVTETNKINDKIKTCECDTPSNNGANHHVEKESKKNRSPRVK